MLRNCVVIGRAVFLMQSFLRPSQGTRNLNYVHAAAYLGIYALGAQEQFTCKAMGSGDVDRAQPQVYFCGCNVLSSEL